MIRESLLLPNFSKTKAKLIEFEHMKASARKAGEILKGSYLSSCLNFLSRINVIHFHEEIMGYQTPQNCFMAINVTLYSKS